MNNHILVTLIREAVRSALRENALKPLSLAQVMAIANPSDVEDVAKWLDKTPDTIVFAFAEVPLSVFQKQIDEMEDYNRQNPKGPDEKRTAKIVRLLKARKKPLPIFVDKTDGFVLEGRHRLVAFA